MKEKEGKGEKWVITTPYGKNERKENEKGGHSNSMGRAS